MNKILLLFGVVCFLGCERTKVANKKNFSTQVESARQELQKIGPELTESLEKYRTSVLSGDPDLLYSIRTAEFQKIVSQYVAREVLFAQRELPSKIIFYKIKRTPEKNRIIICTLCSFGEGELSYESLSEDIWIFDQASKSWFFEGNNLPWGSSVYVKP